MYSQKPLNVLFHWNEKTEKVKYWFEGKNKERDIGFQILVIKTLKATVANRKRGPGTREKVRSKRINLEGNTHRKLMWVNSLYSYPYLNQQKPLFLPIIAYTFSSTKLEIRAK
jgi:hypothetical protein